MSSASAYVSASGDRRVRVHRTGSVDVEVNPHAYPPRSSHNYRAGDDVTRSFERGLPGGSSPRSRLNADASFASTNFSKNSGMFEDFVADEDASKSFLSHADPDSLLKRLKELRSELSGSDATKPSHPPRRGGNPTAANTKDNNNNNNDVDRLFNKIDKNSDGVVNKREMLLAMRKSETVSRQLGFDGRAVTEGSTRKTFEHMFQSADRNDDRVLTKEEFRSYYSSPSSNEEAKKKVAPQQSPKSYQSQSSSKLSKSQWVEERLAQLDQEQADLKAQLASVSSPINSSQAEWPLLVTGDPKAAFEANELVRPLLTEYSRLIGIMRRGAFMRMALKLNDDGQVVRRVHVSVSDDFSSLMWRRAQSSESKLSKSECYSAQLEDIAAVICGGERESAFMSCDEETVFRIHFRRSGVDPMHFAASSKQERQDWVVGLALFHGIRAL